MISTDYTDVCVHDGKVFEITGSMTITGTTTFKLLGAVKDARVKLLNYFIRSNQGLVEIRLVEEPTVTDNGTPTTAINRNRNFSNVSDTLVYTSPTSSGGSVIYSSRLHDVGGGAHIQGGDAEMPSIFVLKDNTNYVFEIYNGNVADTEVSFEILWCEEE